MNLIRTPVLLVLLLLLFINTYADEGFKIGDKANVWNTEGLALKQQAGVTSKNILVIPYGQSVTIINDARPSSPGSEKIDFYGGIYKLKGSWVKVAYKGRQGYVFDGYLSKMPPLKKSEHGSSESDEDYLKRIYGVRGVKRIKGRDGYEKTTTHYRNGNTSISTFFDGCFDTELYIKGINYREAILLLEAGYSDGNAPIEDLKIKELKGMVKVSYSFCD
jgi:hypothetical protein